MESQVWQPISGAKGVEIYPYIRRMDLMSSNSYLISSRNQIALIDPGGLDDQMDHLFEKIVSLRDDSHRPIVIYLTHVHADHCLQLSRLEEFRDLGGILLAVQENGAKALQTQDSKLTLAYLLEKQMARVPVDIELFSSRERVSSSIIEREMEIKGAKFSYSMKSLKISDDLKLESRAVHLGDGNDLEIYHTPGHSPDSICLHLGGILFIGDIFIAPNPGVAGTYGWSQSDLQATIRKVIWILEHHKIDVCCSGHGRNLDTYKALRALRSMYKEVASLSDLEEVNLLWARNVAAYAEDLMSELERVFTIIAGRLTYISHVLEELEEISEAKEAESLLDLNQIDELFIDFNTFASELHDGRKLDIELVHKAGQIVGRLDKVFENSKIGSILDQSLLTRASRMISDYVTTYRGFKPSHYVVDTDINSVINEVLSRLVHKPYEEEAILNAESDEGYLWALKSRIAHIDLFENVAITFDEGQNLPDVHMDKERFTDALMDIFERLVGAQAESIRIATSNEDLWVSIRIQWAGLIENPPSGRVLRFFERTFALCGGFIQTCSSENGPAIEIEFVSTNQT